VLVALGSAAHEAGDLERAQAVLEEAIVLARDHADAHAEWLGRLALEWLASETEPEGGADRLLREAEAAIAARSGAGDHDVLARAWRLVAEACSWRGQWDGYADALDRAAEHARLAGDVALEIGYVRQKAPYFIFGPGAVDDGLAWTAAVLEPLGDVAGVPEYALHVRGHMLARRGESERAFEAVETFRKRLRELGRETEYLWTAGCVWDIARWTGVWEQGEAALLDARAAAERVGSSIVRSGLELDLGEAAFLQGRLDEAERLIELGRELSATDDAANILKWATVAAQLRAEHGDLAAAEEIARDAVARADPDEFLEIAAETRLVLADVLRRKGDDLTARAAAAEAVELFERKGNVVGAGRARAALVVLPPAPDR
jgi:tetratricopeptide (TPR) repeat protein